MPSEIAAQSRGALGDQPLLPLRSGDRLTRAGERLVRLGLSCTDLLQGDRIEPDRLRLSFELSSTGERLLPALFDTALILTRVGECCRLKGQSGATRE